MSASSSPTRRPCRASATARFEDRVDLPTPPLPEAMATMRSTPLTRCGPACGVGWPPIFSDGAAAFGVGPCAVSTAETPVTPGKARTAASAACRSGSICRAICGSGASMTKRTAPDSTDSARTRSALTRSFPSGSEMRRRASRMRSLVGSIVSPFLSRPISGRLAQVQATPRGQCNGFMQVAVTERKLFAAGHAHAAWQH